MKTKTDDAKFNLSSLPGTESVAVGLSKAILAGHAAKPLSVHQKARLLGCSDRQVFRLAADHDTRLAAIVAADTRWMSLMSLQQVAMNLGDLEGDIADGLPDLATACRELRKRIEDEVATGAVAPWRRRAEEML